jgi:guanylate kinase
VIFVLFGPGGAGKGTVAARLVSSDPSLWLSRSWTTRDRRPGETDDAYHFVDRGTFMTYAGAGGFFEWAEFLGNLYGTPIPTPDEGSDVLLEIDLEGARQVRQKRPDATLILLVPPSTAAQEARLRTRGDDEAHIARRLRAGAEEERLGRAIADAVVTNHDVAQAAAEVAGIVGRCRRSARRGGEAGPDPDIGPTTGAGSPDPTRQSPPDERYEGS